MVKGCTKTFTANHDQKIKNKYASFLGLFKTFVHLLFYFGGRQATGNTFFVCPGSLDARFFRLAVQLHSSPEGGRKTKCRYLPFEIRNNITCRILPSLPADWNAAIFSNPAMAVSGSARTAEGDLNFSLVPAAFFWIWSNFQRRVPLCVFKVFLRRYLKKHPTRLCSYMLVFLSSFWVGFFFFASCVVAKWERLAESGLTAGVGPENGGCYREGMQRARGTLPSCYRRHESKWQIYLCETNELYPKGK